MWNALCYLTALENNDLEKVHVKIYVLSSLVNGFLSRRDQENKTLLKLSKDFHTLLGVYNLEDEVCFIFQ